MESFKQKTFHWENVPVFESMLIMAAVATWYSGCILDPLHPWEPVDVLETTSKTAFSVTLKSYPSPIIKT